MGHERLFGWVGHFFGGWGWKHGARPARDSAHRPATHQDRYSKAARDKRKAKRRMAKASRRRNR